MNGIFKSMGENLIFRMMGERFKKYGDG